MIWSLEFIKQSLLLLLLQQRNECRIGLAADTLVPVERVVAHEPASTALAAVRLLASVKAHMSLAIMSASKSQRARIAEEWPVLRVRLHMRCQVVGSGKDLAAPRRFAHERIWLDLELDLSGSTFARGRDFLSLLF